MDQPIFWIQKLDKEGQSEELHDAWIDLVQRIEKGSFLEQQLVKCLMKWYTKKNNLTQESLDGITASHICFLWSQKYSGAYCFQQYQSKSI